MQSNYKLIAYELSYCSLFVFAFYSQYTTISFSIWIAIVIFAIANTIFDINPIVLPSGDSLSLALPVIFTVGLIYGTSIIFAVNSLTAIALCFLQPKKWVSHIFNCVQYSLSGVAGFWSYHMVDIYSTELVSKISAFIAYSIAFYISNVIFVAIFLKLRNNLSFNDLAKIFTEKKAVLIYFTVMSLGFLMAVVVRSEGLAGFVIFSIILWGLSISYRSYYKMFVHFRALSEKDEMTKLFNYRYFQECLETTLVNNDKVALLLLDLDRFKAYNDAFGHPMGDKLLYDVATIITGVIPDSGIACRYGGEEFAVILPHTDTEEAMLTAEEIRKAIAEYKFEGVEHLPHKRMTASIGVSTYPAMAASREELIMLADQALYKSKSNNRNKVQLYTSVIDEMKDSFKLGSDEDEIIKTLKPF